MKKKDAENYILCKKCGVNPCECESTTPAMGVSEWKRVGKKYGYWDYFMKVKCGEANLKGNIELTYKGGCRKELDLKDAYRCVGCGGWFHKECIIKHFELEKEHDIGRNNLRAEIKRVVEWKLREVGLSRLEGETIQKILK